ncbi:MAG: alpha/beta fold hydrolase [Desulfobacteraceae bacterium]|nr:alpha/beta fold hydrolase [Desulfobacteraceae bacterium]
MSFFKTTDGCSLYYEDLGFSSGKPVVVFLNGTMQTTLYWKVLADKFRNHFGVLLYDARSQGASELGDSPLSLQGHIQDLMSLMDYLEIDKAHLVGVSHGAYVAYSLAAQSAHRVRRLVMCSVGAQSSFRSRLIVRSWLETLKTGGLDAAVWSTLPHVFGETFLRRHANILDRIVKSVVRRNNSEALQAHLTALLSYTPMSKSLKPLDRPLLVISGADDPLVTAEGALLIARTCGGRHVKLQGVGHSIPAEAPEIFTKTVVNFLTANYVEAPEGH